MRRATVNFVVDIVSFVIFLALAATGSILRYVLPPGSGGQGFRGGRPLPGPNQLWGLVRHEWGDIHFWLAVTFVILMIVHIILHWGWIKCYVRSWFTREECESE